MDNNIKALYEELMENVNSYIENKEEIEMIEKAFDYASKMHFGVKRLTGEDYIIHPLSVAVILSNMESDTATICAGLLHDVLEDCDVTEEEMTKEFNKEITFLVDGVTKINRVNFESKTAAQIATKRKILVGLCKDVRVIFIKLADRLHNMRTLWVHNEKTQKEKAKETLDILTPIAHRLGMNAMKIELEDLSLRYLRPDVYYDIVKELNNTKSEREASVSLMIDKVSNILKENNIDYKIKGRAKSIYSIYKKLDKGKKFSDIYDILALRILVDTEHECYQALGLIHSKYRPISYRFKDYIAMPKTNMYQSLHSTVFGVDGCLFEIQIRTYEMDEVAEKGIASHWSYKEKGSNVLAKQDIMEQKLQVFKSIMDLDDDSTDEEFIKNVTEEVFNNTIYVFTPVGDVIELPLGATPIDFAYRVHSAVGDKMVGAMVNNNIATLDYILQDGDIVKINTNKNSDGPSLEWVNIAYTQQAKNKIRAFFKKADKEEYIKTGEEILNKELKRKKIPLAEFFTNENKIKILDDLKYNSLDEVYINIGNSKLAPNTVINIIYGEEKKEDIVLKKITNKETEVQVKTDIIVAGTSNIKTNIASCCKPVPGDRILGYITKGYGVTVHRRVCPNVKDLDERIIDVKWNDNIEKKYPTSIVIRSLKTDNMLVDIVAKVATYNINIQNINTFSDKTETKYTLTVLVNNKETLMKLINNLRSIDKILEVERIIK